MSNSRSVRISFPVFLSVISLFCLDGSAQGLFSRKKGSTPNSNSVAIAEFSKAKSFEAAGKYKQARDTYKSILKSNPDSEVGAEAQYRLAGAYDLEGNHKKAYDEYEVLINRYRTTGQFQNAIEQQFHIAEKLRNHDKKGLFGFGAPIQPSELKAMYQKIARSAPYTQFAPKSLMAVAEIDAGGGQGVAAINSYQAVVDNYRGTPYAKDAQYEIYKIRGEAAKQSNSPSEDRAQVDAGLSFVSENPTDARSAEVKAGLEEIEERSLKKMLDTGQFYETSGNYKSALVYYQEIAKKPNSRIHPQAMTRIGEVEKLMSGETIQQKTGILNSLPSLPKLRIGKKSQKVTESALVQ